MPFEFLVLAACTLAIYAACRLVPARWRATLLAVTSLAVLASIDRLLPGVVAAFAILQGFGVAWISRGTPAQRPRRYAYVLAADLFYIAGIDYVALQRPGADVWLAERGWEALSGASAGATVGASFYALQGAWLAWYAARTTRVLRMRDVVLSMSLAPYILAGPLRSPGAAMRMVERIRPLPPSQLRLASMPLLIGLASKVVVANRLSEFVAPVLSSPDRYEGAAMVISLVLLPVYVAADVAGYLLIAYGLGVLLGLVPVTTAAREYLALRSAGFAPLLRRLRRAALRATGLRGAAGQGVATVALGAAAGLWHRPTLGFVAAGAWCGGWWLALVSGRRGGCALEGSGLRGFGVRVAAWGAASVGLAVATLESLPEAGRFIARSIALVPEILLGLGELGQHRGVLGPLPGVVPEGEAFVPIALAGAVLVSFLVWGPIRCARALRRLGERWPVASDSALVLLILLSGRFGQPFLYFWL